MKRLGRHLVATYLSFDPRSLGLFRILLGLVLLADLYRRYLGVDYWYTEDGIVPTSFIRGIRWTHMFSLFLWVSTRTQAVLAMAACAAVYGLFTIGFKTRLFHLLSLVCVVSLNNRIWMLENGGQLTLNLLCVWSLFLPLGRSFSVDSLIGSLRARRESTPEQLADRDAMRPAYRPVVSLAALALLLQFAVIYWLSTVQKTGPAWKDGSAAHFTLYHERLVTALGVWIRENVSLSILEIFSWGTLALEGAAAFLILCPVWPAKMRLAAIALLPPLHLGFAATLHIGIFSPAMISFYALLVAREHWEWLDRRRRRRGLRKIAYFDADCGICFMFARIFARLDPAGRVRFVSNRQGPLPEGVTRSIVERAIVVENAVTGRAKIGAAGIADLIRELPFGSVSSLPLRLPCLAQIAEVLYGVLARNRTAVSRRLGLAACGVPTEAVPATPEATRGPIRRWTGRVGVGLREATVVLLAFAAVSDLAASNPAWPASLRVRQNELFAAIVWYPRLHQFWYMFCPEPARSAVTIAVEAETLDGRIVDPYNEVASRYATIPAPDGKTPMPTRLGQSQFFATFSDRIVLDKFAGYRQPFRKWIFRHSERTGEPADKVMRFRVYAVRSLSPRPGSDHQGRMTRKLVFAYPPG